MKIIGFLVVATRSTVAPLRRDRRDVVDQLAAAEPNSEEPIVCGRARAYKRWSHPSSECARPAAAPERDGRGSSTALTNTASNNAPIGLGIRAPLPPT
jgi:hypothetical protein